MESKMQLRSSDTDGPKLTNWAKEPTLRALKQDLDSSKQSQQAQMLKIRRWNDLMSVSGTSKIPKVKGRSSVQPKLIRRQAEWRYSALTEPFLGSNKLFKVSPVTFEDELGAKQNELVLNWQFRTKMNRVKFVDDYIRATVDEGTCIVRLGWTRTVVKVKERVPRYDHFDFQSQEQVDAFKQALEMSQADPRTFDEQADGAMKAAVKLYVEQQIPTVAMEVGTELVETERVIENYPTAEVMNPQNVYIDPTCGGDFNKALFVVVSFETNQAELKKNPERYKNLETIDWNGAATISEPDHETKTPQDFQFTDEARKKVVAYEYWGFADIKGDGKLVPIVATWIGSTLIRMEENPFPDEKLPFVIVNYLPVKRDLYGEPDAELLEDNQKVQGAVMRGMIDLLGRSANSQIGYAKGMLDPLNRRRMENGQDYEFNPNVNPKMGGLIEHTYPELPQSALAVLTLQNNDAEALTGVKSFSGGVSGEAYGDVAAGIRGALDAASKREMAILRRLAKGMTEIGTKIIAMNSIFLSEEEVVRVTNNEFVTINREDLKGNFDLETDISTAEVDNAKAQDLGFMLQTIGPNMDNAITMKILAEIADLKRMPALAQQLRTWKPEPSPEQQRLQQLEIEKAEAEVAKLKSEIDLNQAKAEQARAQKDMTNLDYVETETGTKHARDMDKMRGQSQGNQALQVTKALTTPKKEGEKAPDVEAAIGFNQLSDKLSEAGTSAPPAESVMQRDVLAEEDPAFSLGSRFYDPSLDPSSNPNLNIA